MKNATIQTAPPEIEPLILEIRRHKVILDAELARIYGVQTKALNQAVKRNHARFPGDFVFKLSAEEIRELNRSQIVTGSPLRSQIVTSKEKRGGRRYLPHAFTEHGAIMAANVLNSQRAVDMSVFVVRAFVKMRSAFGDSRELARKLALLEQELKIRLNIHEAAIVDVLQRIMKILDPPPPLPNRPRRKSVFMLKRMLSLTASKEKPCALRKGKEPRHEEEALCSRTSCGPRGKNIRKL